jgi:hypothetical protein
MSYSVLWWAVRAHSSNPPHATWGKQLTSFSLYLLAIPAAFYSRGVSLAMISFVAVMWLLPPTPDESAEGDYGHSPARRGAAASSAQVENSAQAPGEKR